MVHCRMPYRIDNTARVDDLLLAADRILLERGLDGLSLRALARETRISLGALTGHLDNRTRVLRLLAARATKRWVAWMEERVKASGPLGMLPDEEESLDPWRVYLIYCDMSRGIEVVRAGVENPWPWERTILWAWAGWAPVQDGIELLLASVHGLQRQVCATLDPMPPGRAREILEPQVRAVLTGPRRPGADELEAWLRTHRGWTPPGLVERSDGG